MTIATTKTGEIVKKAPTKADNLASILDSMLPQIKRALPKHVDPDRMLRIAVTALRQNPDLGLCTPASFIGCVMQTAQLGLEPNTPLGLSYLIPRKNKRLEAGQRECTLIIGYQGQMDLSRRGGVPVIYSYVVREGDSFRCTLGTDAKIEHEPSDAADREDKPITHAYAVAKVAGEPVFVVLSKAQIEKRRARSAAAEDGPWITDYEAMCQKTVLRALWKFLPKSAEMQRAEAVEDTQERGASITAALDPIVSDAMLKNGLIGDDAEVIDTETGEVKATVPQNGNSESKATAS